MLSIANFFVKFAILGMAIAVSVYPKIVTNWAKLLIEILANNYFYSAFSCFTIIYPILLFIYLTMFFPLLSYSVEWDFNRNPAAYMKVERVFLSSHW